MKAKMWMVVFLGVALMVPVNPVKAEHTRLDDLIKAGQTDVQKAEEERKAQEERELALRLFKESETKIKELKQDLKNEVTSFRSGSYFIDTHLKNLQNAFTDLENEKTSQALDKFKSVVSEAHSSVEKNIYSSRRELEKEVEKYHALKRKYSFHDTAQALQELTGEGGIYEDVGLDKNSGALVVTLTYKGKDYYVPLEQGGQLPRSSSNHAHVSEPSKDNVSGSRERSEITDACSVDHGRYYSRRSRRSKEGRDDDSKVKEPSTFETVSANLMPWVALLGSGVAAGFNFSHAQDLERNARGLMTDALNKGQSPYAYMGLLHAAYNYDPFSVLNETVPAALFAMEGLYNGRYNRGGQYASPSKWETYNRNKKIQNLLMMQMMRQQQQGSGNMSSNTTQTIQMQQSMQALKNLADQWNPEKMFDAFEKNMDKTFQQTFGGVSQRQMQDMLNMTSNLANSMNSAVQTQLLMRQLMDNMKVLAGQGRQALQNLDNNIAGQGGLTWNLTRTRTNNMNNSWNGQGNGNMIGNPGWGQMPGQPSYGGGGWYAAPGPNGTNQQFGGGFQWQQPQRPWQ